MTSTSDPGAGHFRAAGVDTSTWDGPAVMAACAALDNPAPAYRAVCAGKRNGDEGLQSTWALPHHKSPGAAPNATGVRNSLARLPGTLGLINKTEARAHLENHMTVIQANSGSHEIAHLRASAIRQDPQLRIPNGPARSQPFTGQVRHRIVQRDGKDYLRVDGYASVFDLEYEMYDMFGLYWESVDPGAFRLSLQREQLDVAFLVNHRGVTMARTTNGTLTVSADDHGLLSEAYLRMDRFDVQMLASALDEENVTEMSFAFMLNRGEWDSDYEHFSITEADIHRGDVSAVNYGANPYTSIASRSTEILASLDHLPAGAARAALTRLQGRADLQTAPAQWPWPSPPAGRGLQAGPASVPSGLDQLGTGHGSHTGEHTHSHPAYGAQGGDLTHEHAHSHSGDGNHAHAHGNAAPPPPPATGRTVAGLQAELDADEVTGTPVPPGQGKSLALALAEFEADNALDADIDTRRGRVI